MNPRLIWIFLVVTASCTAKTNDWQRLDFGAFTLKAPSAWKKFKQQGIDAYVGGLTNGKDSLWFYYGMYISGFDDRDANKYLFAQDTINGKIAAIRIPKRNGEGLIEMFIDNIKDEDKFDLSGTNLSDTSLIFEIFKSVRFDNSDTAKNGTLFSGKFKEYPFGSGRTLYYANCSPCHVRNKSMAGPALTTDLLNSRSREWLYAFFKDRKNLKQDSAYLARKKEFNDFNCIELTNYSKQDVEQLIDYLNGQ